MKLKAIILLVISISIVGLSCNSTNSEEHKMSEEKEEISERQTYKSVGIIKEIDSEKGTITIDHEDIPGYMSAMEMTEPVADKKLLEVVKVGDKVNFEIERTGSKLIITKIEKIGEDKTVKAFAIYKTNCAECHGKRGEGVEDKGISLVKGHALHHSEEDFIKRVTNGKKDEMPTFKDKLSEGEIKEVVRYVRNEIQSKAKQKENSGHKH